MAVPLPILGGAYTDETRPLSSQDTCNYILFPAEKAGTRTEGQLIDAPGLVPFAGVGDGPHRGARDVEGKLFVVSGRALYQVHPDGTSTNIGVIPGTDRVSMTHNQIESGNELLIGTRDNSYLYNTVTGTLSATGIPLYSVDFLNQLFLGIDQGRRFGRYSGLADGTSWNTLDNVSAEAQPDRIAGGIVSQGEWLIFGERAIEVMAHSPTASTAFQRVQVIERGCASPETICRLDNSVIFLGNDNILYRLEGYSPRPISTHVLTREWGNRDPRKAFAFTYEDKGRVIYYLTHKDGQTFGYDVTTGEFHRRESYGFNRWRLNTLVKWAGSWYGGDFADGTLWRLDWLYMKEGCDEIARYRRTGVLSDNQRRVTVNSVELLLDTGRDVTEVGDSITVTGDIPDGFVGDTVDYQYTIQTAYPGQSYTLEVTGLPTGMTISDTGHVTGTYAAAGEFSTVVTATSDCGGQSSSEAGVVVTEYPFHFLATGAANRTYIGTTADTWSQTTDNGENGVYVLFSAGRVLLLGTNYLQVSDDYFATPVSTIVVPWAAITDHPFLTASGRIYVTDGAAQSIYYSDDNGDTWTTVNTGFTCTFFAGDDVALVIGSGTHYRVSTTGAAGFGSSIAPSFGAIGGIDYGDGMFMFTAGPLSASAYWSEDSCTTLTPVALPAPGGDEMETYSFTRTSSGAWLAMNRVSGNSTSEIVARSADGKVAFAYVTTPPVNTGGNVLNGFAERNGIIVGSVSNATSLQAFIKSEDDGLTWSVVNHTFTGFSVTRAFSIVAIKGA